MDFLPAPTWSWENLTTNAVFPSVAQGDKLVLILSDSYLKYIKKLHSGDLIRKSGGQFQTLAPEMAKYDLTRYRYIIVHVGFNEGKIDDVGRWERSWHRFESVSGPEILRRGANAHSILFSLGFPHPDFKHSLTKHNFWLSEKLESSGYSVAITKWRTGKPLFDDDGNLNKFYFDEEAGCKNPIHFNHQGTGVLWASGVPI